jgi:hypothetical protein
MKNIGKRERRFRCSLALFMLCEAWFAPGIVRIVFLFLAAYFAITAWARFCPVWWLIRIDSRETNTIEVLRGYTRRPK